MFKKEIVNKFNGQVNCYETFEQFFISISNKHAPLKKKVFKKEMQARLLYD